MLWQQQAKAAARQQVKESFDWMESDTERTVQYHEKENAKLGMTSFPNLVVEEDSRLKIKWFRRETRPKNGKNRDVKEGARHFTVS
jgi:protein-disulfide isomerase-like protein with CxxC motif